MLWLALAHLPALAQSPDGATPVSPFIVGETWTASHSPYCVTSGVFVAGLSLESDVTVWTDSAAGESPSRLPVKSGDSRSCFR